MIRSFKDAATARLFADEDVPRFRAIERQARRKLLLLDGAGSPVPEALIRQELGELERQAYCMMFCLDEKTLAEGGQGILESKGDLGKLLFAASAGLEDLHKRLAGVRDAADAVLDHDHRAVDDQAEVDRPQAHQAGGDSRQRHQVSGKQHRQGNRQGHDNACPETSQRQKQHDDD